MMANANSSRQCPTQIESDDRIAVLAKRLNEQEIQNNWRATTRTSELRPPIIGSSDRPDIYNPTFFERIFG